LALTLEEIHTVEAEGFDLDEGLGAMGHRFREGGVDEKGGDGASTVFDVCKEDAVRPTISPVG
jgi:hypothetical protein